MKEERLVLYMGFLWKIFSSLAPSSFFQPNHSVSIKPAKRWTAAVSLCVRKRKEKKIKRVLETLGLLGDRVLVRKRKA